MSAKSKSIAHGHVDPAMLGLVEGQVEPGIKFWIVGKMVDGGRDKIVLNGQNAGYGFDRAGCTQEMPRHRFGGAYIHFKGMVAEYRLDGLDFRNIAQGG